MSMTSNMKSASCWVMHIGGLILNTFPSKPPLPISTPMSFILSKACNVASFAGACTARCNPLDKCNIRFSIVLMPWIQDKSKSCMQQTAGIISFTADGKLPECCNIWHPWRRKCKGTETACRQCYTPRSSDTVCAALSFCSLQQTTWAFILQPD